MNTLRVRCGHGQHDHLVQIHEDAREHLCLVSSNRASSRQVRWHSPGVTSTGSGRRRRCSCPTSAASTQLDGGSRVQGVNYAGTASELTALWRTSRSQAPIRQAWMAARARSSLARKAASACLRAVISNEVPVTRTCRGPPGAVERLTSPTAIRHQRTPLPTSGQSRAAMPASGTDRVLLDRAR
jgi:hypothetical protein